MNERIQKLQEASPRIGAIKLDSDNQPFNQRTHHRVAFGQLIEADKFIGLVPLRH